MNVLIIPEDPTLDRFILRPIVEQIFKDLGKSPWVDILNNPRLRGVAQALNRRILEEVIASHRMFDLFLVLVDRDGDERRQESASQREVEHQGKLFVCLAVEEIEVWMLALHHKTPGLPWKEVRAEVHPKERFAQPFLEQIAPKLDHGDSRAWVMRDLGAHWKGVLQRCPELKKLQQRIEEWLKSR